MYQRARHFAFPIKLRDPTRVTKAITETFNSTSMMLHGGRSFEAKIGRTETMTAKEVVQNVLQALQTITSLVIYSGTTKNNYVREVYLSTSKSLPISIYEHDITSD